MLVHADAGGYKPLNWMTPPVVLEDERRLLVVRKRAGRSEDRLEIRLLEVLSDVEHEMGEAAGAREGRRRARSPGGARRDARGARPRAFASFAASGRQTSGRST